jgi:hypothetical protein
MPYEIIETSSGAKSLVYRDGREIRIHSGFDPVKEAERSVAAFDSGKKNIIAVAGTGLGYHVKALKQKFPDKIIIALEKDAEVIRMAKKVCPANISGIITISHNDDLSKLFEEFDISSFKGFAVYTHRPSYSLDPNFYDTLLTEMNKYVSSKISDLLTRFEFEDVWAENIIANLPRLFSSPTVQQLFGVFKGYPGVIVSAGPSLKKNASLIASLSDKALICCVDTSFKVLTRMGISPHIVMTLDAQKHSLRHFLGIADAKPYLLADLVSYPKISQRYNGTVVYSTTSKYYNDENGNLKRETTPLMDWVEQYVPQIGDIQSGGSVATSLFDFMLNTGCNPVILVGQDLAYTGREIHTSGTYHNDEWLTHVTRTYTLDTINQKIIRKRKIKYVKAWGSQSTVITDYVLDLYRQWFEDSFAKVPLTIINATEGGAFIANTKEEYLSSLAESLKTKKPSPLQLLDGILLKNSFISSDAFIKAVESTLPHLEAISKCNAENHREVKAYLSKITDRNFEKLLAPYLKKTNAYLNRHAELDGERADALLARDIVRACSNLAVRLKQCKKMIHELNV